MVEGDIVLTPVAQADGQIKNRPALILRQLPPFGDMLVCGISSQVQQEVVGFDEIVYTTDSDFAASGLRLTSLIRLSFLAVLPVNRIIGTIGSLARTRRQRLLRNLADHLLSEAD